jgi:type VII secretion integral membrane protein EccD
MAGAAPEMCRVTIVTAHRWADVALPATEPLIDLLPALLDHIGDTELTGQPVTLQKLGSQALQEGRSLAANGVLDGETLYLTPVTDQMPMLDFDDSIAGLGEGISKLRNRWTPTYTRRMLLLLGILPIVGGWFLLVNRAGTSAGPAWLTSVLAMVATMLLVLGSSVASRAWNDRVLSLLLGGGALAFAVGSAALAVRATGELRVLSPLVGLAAAAAAFAVASLLDRAVGGLSVAFGGVAFAATLTAAASAMGLYGDWTTQQVLCMLLVMAVISCELVVTLSCRITGLWLPPLPRNAEELEEGIEPVPGQQMLTAAVQVDQYVTSLLWGAAVVTFGTSVVLAPQTGWVRVLLLVSAAGCLLRVRAFYGYGQRAALLTAGIAGPLAIMGLAGWRGGLSAVWVALVFLVLAVLLFVGALSLPGRRAIPHFGRAAEILELLMAISLLPVLLAALGTYQALRNIR